MSFNDSQSRAIAFGNGPAMVLAGAGSGKTTVITHRILSLIQNNKVDPASILVITFTKAAANEMKSRFLKISGQTSTKVTFGTFHAIFFMVLKVAYHFTADNIVSEELKYSLMRSLIQKHGLDARDENEMCSTLLGDISYIKNCRIDIKNYYSNVCSESVFRDIYREYNDYLYQNRLIDFDDMMTYTLELFEQRPDILALWQKKYQYILIDEFQDINQIQFDIIKLLARPKNNIFVVGDDDQSIYRFRGSKPEIMLHFKDVYPNVEEILLDTNYRCDASICEMAMKLISNNHLRFDKKINAARENCDAVELLEFHSTEDENKWIATTIRSYMENGQSLNDFAILYRTNSGPRTLMEQFLNKNIEFQVRDKIPNLFDHWAVKDIRTYIRIAVGCRDRSEFYKIMNKPLRYLGRDSLPEEQVAFDEWEKVYADKPWVVERIYKLQQDLRIISSMAPYSAINYIRKGVGYDDYIASFAEEHDIKKEELILVLDEFQQSAKGYKTFAEFNDHIKATEEAIKKANAKMQKVEDAVTFSTLHSAKGLEFKHVFIIDINEGNIPYKKAIMDEDIEEERRLFYVGMTRAKDKLTLCSVNNPNDKDCAISRFIEEIEE